MQSVAGRRVRGGRGAVVIGWSEQQKADLLAGRAYARVRREAAGSVGSPSPYESMAEVRRAHEAGDEARLRQLAGEVQP